MYEQMQKRSGTMPYTTGISVLVVSPIIAVIFSGILFAIFNAAMGGEASFKQVFAVLAHAGVISAVSTVVLRRDQLLPAGPMGSVANLGALLPMLSENSFAAHLLGMVDLFLIWYIVVLAIGPGRAVPPADAADRDLAAVVLRGDRYRQLRSLRAGVGEHESEQEDSRSGLGSSSFSGASRTPTSSSSGRTASSSTSKTIQKRDLQAIVSASGKIQPQRLVNISADTMGRVTDLAVEEGQSVQKGQFLLQIDPRNLTTAYNQTRRRSPRRARRWNSCACRSTARRRR